MKRTITLILSIAFSLTAMCQNNDIQKEFDEEGTINFFKFKNDKSKPNLSDAHKFLMDSLKILKGNELKLYNSEKDNIGFTIEKFQQHYNGLPVEHGIYSVFAKNNKVEYAAGSYKDIKDIDTKASLSEKEALKKTLAYVAAKKYKWENNEEENYLKKINNDTSSTYYPVGKLVIIKDFLKTNSVYRLAYKFNVYAEVPLSRKNYYIDAINGTIINIEELIMDGNVNGTADTRYSGTNSIVGVHILVDIAYARLGTM